jgi:TonB family protein
MPSQTREERSIQRAAAQISAVGETVEVLGLTADAALLAALKQAVGANQRVWHAPDPEQAVELVMAGRVGVIVIDALATGMETAAFCERLRAQFPDLVLIVAGGVDEQTHLIKQITAGDVYRFLHKPVSTARARQFIEAAVRRHLEGRTFTPAETATAPRKLNPRLLIAGAVVLGVLAIGAGLYAYFAQDVPVSEAVPEEAEPPSPIETPTAATEVVATPAPWVIEDPAQLLARANAALTQGHLVTPPEANALDLYRAVLARDAANSEAQAGLDRIADQLLGNAENALLEQRIDDAARDIEAARRVRPNNVRLAFLSAQLGKERDRRVVALAREAAAKGNHQRARALIDRALAERSPPSPTLLEARKDLELLKRGDSVEELLRLANERMKQDRLYEPANDNARAYIERALTADPTNASALQARRALADQMLARGRQAIKARSAGPAATWLAQAEALGADRTTLRTAQRELQALRQTTARGEEVSRVLRLMNERIVENQLIEPVDDNAKFYWQHLRTLDASNVALPAAQTGIGVGLVRQSRQALEGRNFDEAQRRADEAKSLGYQAPELTSLESDIAAARERAAFLADVVQAYLLARDKQVAPRYPEAAQRKGVEGWVDLDFTIAVDGAVKDIAVKAAQPLGVFDQAATRALSQWRYRPVIRDGRAVEQRARLRVRFDLDG